MSYVLFPTEVFTAKNAANYLFKEDETAVRSECVYWYKIFFMGRDFLMSPKKIDLITNVPVQIRPPLGTKNLSKKWGGLILPGFKNKKN